jgi:hypothetical protein
MDFFACVCTNGTRLAVSSDASVVIDVPTNDTAPGPAPAPAPSPAAAPLPAAAAPAPAAAPPRPPRPDGLNVDAWVANLQRSYPTQCTFINKTLLDSPISRPGDCGRVPVGLGTRCWSTCRFTLRAVGYSCYAVALAKTGTPFDPVAIGSNTTVAFDQCSNNVPYTTAAAWKPVSPRSPPPPRSPLAEPPAEEVAAAAGPAAAPPSGAPAAAPPSGAPAAAAPQVRPGVRARVRNAHLLASYLRFGCAAPR